MANLSVRCNQRFRDAAELYTLAFAADPKAAQSLAKNYHHRAASAAALAAAQGESVVYTTTCSAGSGDPIWPTCAKRTCSGNLFEAVGADRTNLWSDVERLATDDRSRYTETGHKDQLTSKERERSCPIKMSVGKT